MQLFLNILKNEIGENILNIIFLRKKAVIP